MARCTSCGAALETPDAGLCPTCVDLRPGENEPPQPAAPKPTAAPEGGRTGTLAILLVLGAALMIIPFAFFSMSSSIDGSFELGKELGGGSFTPDACTAGSIHGFGGVELTSSDRPGLRVRVIEDAVGTWRVAWLQKGGAAQIFDESRCTSLTAVSEFTGTVVNEVRTMQGHVRLDCDQLSGEITFDGCGP